MNSCAKVLCIDDDADDRLFLREAIIAHSPDWEIIEVSDGTEALEFLSKAKRSGQLPSLIIMDINMPKMDGKKTIPLIKDDPELAAIPLVIFTTSSNFSDRNFFLEYDVKFITKPSHYNDFLQKVNEMLTEFVSNS